MREDLLASDKHLDINSSRIAMTPTADNDTPATVEVKSQSSVPMWGTQNACVPMAGWSD